jgi:subtilisin family serine protease
MASRGIALLAVLSIVTWQGPVTAHAAGGAGAGAGGSSPMIVLLRDNIDPSAKLAQYGLLAKHVYTHGLLGFAADISVAKVAALSGDPDVVMVTPDNKRAYGPGTLRMTPFRGIALESAAGGGNLTGSTPIEQIPQIAARGFRRIGGLSMRSVTVNNHDDRINADIAILDSGIQPNQPDLRVAGGVDCADNTGNWGDVAGHGTIVAGIAAARDNSFGIVGVAAGARLWSVRVLDSNLVGDDSAVLCGIEWVTAHSATIDVANMSLSGPGTDDGQCGLRNHDAIHFAICQSVKAGVVYVAGAGNSSFDVRHVIPAAYSEVITVSGIADSDGAPGGLGGPEPCEGFADDTFALFSNFGSRVDIAAPAVCIASTYFGSDVAVDSGTSYATPFATGAAAVYIASHRGKLELRREAGQGRTEAVRLEILSRREQGHIVGDPDGFDEGVLNVAGF